jgi:hypothetical protein
MEILSESALHESRDRLAILDKTKRESVATHGRNAHGLGDAFDHRRRWREVGVTGPEVDDIHSASDELALFLGDSSERVFG